MISYQFDAARGPLKVTPWSPKSIITTKKVLGLKVLSHFFLLFPPHFPPFFGSCSAFFTWVSPYLVCLTYTLTRVVCVRFTPVCCSCCFLVSCLRVSTCLGVLMGSFFFLFFFCPPPFVCGCVLLVGFRGACLLCAPVPCSLST